MTIKEAEDAFMLTHDQKNELVVSLKKAVGLLARLAGHAKNYAEVQEDHAYVFEPILADVNEARDLVEDLL